MATYSPEYSDDEYDFDEEYFAQTYKPLSNLPTPPPSSRDSLIAQSPRSLFEDGRLADSVRFGMWAFSVFVIVSQLVSNGPVS